ncbi:pcpF [Symbiodinium microadriaticum]|nr:pcpF [Symbiodinium microadriaticum]
MLSLHAEALGSAFSVAPDLYPESLRTHIDVASNWIYHAINNGAYKAGFSGSQEAYEDAYHKYFAALDRLEDILIRQQFVAGDVVTETDLRLFPTMFRHDSVYYSRFKLTKAMLWEYPSIWRWMGTMIGSVPGVQESATKSLLQHCKQGYFGRTGSNTIPIGPEGCPECFLEPPMYQRSGTK